jgi:predicted phosphodiesterase
MKPYLQAVTQTSIIVMVETDAKDIVTVQYNSGQTKYFDKTANTSYYEVIDDVPKKYIQRVKLDNLLPGSYYNYRTIQDGDTVMGSTFCTAVLPGEPFRFSIYGDPQNNPKIHNEMDGKVISHKPNFSIYIGDLCGSGTYNAWKNEFFVENELQLASGTPFFNALGNHESCTQLYKAFLQGFEKKKNDQYYSFDYGDVHFLILNTELSLKKNSPQYKFAKNDLESTKQPWKFVIVHKPGYVGGNHGENFEMITLTKEVIEPNHVDATFAGHTHFYQHNLVNGIHHIIVAGGGGRLYNPKKKDYVLKSVKDYHYAIVDVTTKTVTVTVYNLNDKIIDKIELNKKF